MITLDDCIAFCEMPPAEVEHIAEQQGVPLVVACAYAQACLPGVEAEHPSVAADQTLRLAA